MTGAAEARPGRRWRLPLLALLPLVLAVAVGGIFSWGLLNGDDSLPSALVDKPVPEFDLPPIQGRSDGLATADLRGEVSLVNVWASWCAPCRAEMPILVEFARTGAAPVYGINYKDDPKAALKFLADLGDPFQRIGADRTGRVAIDWGVYGVPETFLVDVEGRIAYRHVGPVNRRALETEILPRMERLKAGEDGQ